MEVLARRIIELRGELGLSSEKLAQRLGASHKTVITWEKNRGDPSIENLMALGRIFGVTPDYLLGMTDQRAPSDEDSNPDAHLAATEGRAEALAVRDDEVEARRRPRKGRGTSRSADGEGR